MKGLVTDALFLDDIAHLLPYVVGIEEKTARLGKLYAIEYVEDGWRSISVADCVVSRCLRGDEISYEKYQTRFGLTAYSVEKLKKLQESIINKGYPAGGWITTFGDEPYIRDGRHRAAILYRLNGDIEIPILNVKFDPSFNGWRMKQPTSPFWKSLLWKVYRGVHKRIDY